MLQQRPLRLVFTANAISMLGSGMNTAAVTWYVLQATRSEMALGTLMMLTTIPALLMMPFTGVIIDREDRRRLVMLLDLVRAAVIVIVAVLAFRHQVYLWQLYAMQVLVSAGFWMFWPTVTALIQELTPDAEFVHANTLLLAGVQGGWLMAGAIVGWIYNHVGLGGVLLIDVSSYIASFLCYFAVRKGRVVVALQAPTNERPAGAVARFVHELREGIGYLRGRPYVVLLGTSWSLFIAAMLTQGVVSAPLSDRILHAGAVGYGWLNAGWAIGAFLSAWYAPVVIRLLESRRSVATSMLLLAACLYLLPFSRLLAVAVAFYAIMGSARGVGGVAISSSLMEIVPKHFMGRVQNTFYAAATALQIVLALGTGAIAHRIGLVWGFVIIGTVYFSAALSALWPTPAEAKLAAASESTG
jgi:MFS family permease